jgi:hypothetical protein
MEAAASLKEEMKRFVDSTQVCLDQVKALLGSTANPSDDTSLAVRLSMVKVCVNIYRCHSRYLCSCYPSIAKGRDEDILRSRGIALYVSNFCTSWK